MITLAAVARLQHREFLSGFCDRRQTLFRVSLEIWMVLVAFKIIHSNQLLRVRPSKPLARLALS